MRALTALLLTLPLLASGWASAADHAVVLLYHHVSEDTPPSTSVTPARFEAHLEQLAARGVEVWPLADLLRSLLVDADEVPDDVVAITFDDAYASVHSEALPRLAARGWPFTVFVNTDAIDAGHEPYLDWPALREIARAGGTIANHSATHAHLLRRRGGESTQAWQERVAADIAKAAERIEAEIGEVPRLFAYPYGEDSAALAEIVGRTHDFALVQRSGAVGHGIDPLAVPRFPLATGFDGPDRLELAVESRPLPVTAAVEVPPGDGPRQPLQSLKLSLGPGSYRFDAVNCFLADGSPLAVERTDATDRSLQISIDDREQQGRNKLNCTAPATDGDGVFWYSHQWIVD